MRITVSCVILIRHGKSCFQLKSRPMMVHRLSLFQCTRTWSWQWVVCVVSKSPRVFKSGWLKHLCFLGWALMSRRTLMAGVCRRMTGDLPALSCSVRAPQGEYWGLCSASEGPAGTAPHSPLAICPCPIWAMVLFKSAISLSSNTE